MQNGLALEWVSTQDDLICNAAFRQNPESIRFIRENKNLPSLMEIVTLRHKEEIEKGYPLLKKIPQMPLFKESIFPTVLTFIFFEFQWVLEYIKVYFHNIS